MLLFNSDNNEEEISFADAYKSQILNKDDDDERESSNIIIILLLIAIIIGLSIFGYMYMSKTSQTKEEIGENVKVIEEITEEEPPKSDMLNNIDELIDENSTSSNQDKVKTIDIEKKNIKVEKKELKQKGEETYLEQLAELSKEIDGESKKK